MDYDGTNHVEFMEGTAGEKEWNARCDEIKAFHRKAGDPFEYPPTWFYDIVLSGFVSRAKKEWADV